MRWITIFLVFLTCVIAPDAFGDEPKEPSRVRYQLPEVPTNVDGEKCLNTAEWKMVLLVASEYKGLFDWRLTIEPTLAEYEALEASYILKVGVLNSQIKTLTDDREYLQLRLGQTEKTRNKQRTAYKIEKGIMWAVIAVETIVIGVLGVRGQTR